MRRNFLLLVTSTILIISFGFSTVVSLQSMDVLVKENNRDNSVIYVNEISNAVIDVFSEAVAVSQSMTNIFIRDLLKNQANLTVEQQSEILRKFLSDIVYKFGYSTAYLADAKTMAYYSEHGYSKTVDPSNPDDNWYLPFKESGKLYEFNVDNDQANNNRLTIYINMRILDNTGDFLGVCGVGVPMKQVMNLLQTLEAQSNISIKLASAAMKAYFGKNGWKIYRTGGDEFVALTTKPVGDKNDIVAEFKMQLKQFHHELIKELSVSIGVAKACENKVTSVEELTKIADKKMYADKEIFYSDSSHERRKR